MDDIEAFKAANQKEKTKRIPSIAEISAVTRASELCQDIFGNVVGQERAETFAKIYEAILRKK